MSAPEAPITQLLERWRGGDRVALERLTALIYQDLQRIAANQLRRGHAATLSPTELVNEACLRLIGPDIAWQGRAHFFAVAARQMRNVLVDHARRRMRAKRGGGAAAVTLVTGAGENGGDPIEVLALDQALEQLAAQDPRKRDVLELHYFGGLSYAEMAHALGVSEATVDRDLRFAKAWVRQTLGG